jgi:hypothetical protein
MGRREEWKIVFVGAVDGACPPLMGRREEWESGRVGEHLPSSFNI